ncbi:DUF2808 domain-containing protein [Anabaenopsis tanganyikae CS-531]|uniref:DUF2808 domain-containing protein n=2 Tax=Anabaenopsis TaxID=110103 RepID=A0ABT6KH58_9CYAN|nr:MULTISPECIES: DUF2808 domain-containing protein [Anabaenopsis]MDB9540253.1 DUF2808 domain-containing protein [Anabaenopsis arnoldii]MDH6092651.1 DUF2808 domain-containing protein [Anabaenopsis arnoldii]MDH6107032.1 DUF2808 domain-containing protein [Anabaenopsis tanganyikae CS-531]
MQNLQFPGCDRQLLVRLVSALAVTSSLLTGFPVITVAQGLPGLTLFGGVSSKNQLPFRLDFGGQANSWERFRLRIPAKKMNLAASQFVVSYPDYYEGSFDPNKVEVKVKGEKVPLDEVKWNKEARRIEIFPQKPVAAGGEVELVLSDVKTPSFGGMYYFNCQILSPGDLPLERYVGTWVLSIS